MKLETSTSEMMLNSQESLTLYWRIEFFISLRDVNTAMIFLFNIYPLFYYSFFPN